MTPSAPRLAEWLTRLESYSPREIDLGLERVHTLLARLDLALPDTVIHVAGTNGKGSSVAYASRLLQAAGAPVGSYTSPHVHRFNERVAVDGVVASDAELVAAIERVDAVRGDTALTYFEFTTLAALAVFEQRGVGIAVLEVGMGGRLDAVNAIEPVAGLITNVAMDHMEWLGPDVETIAREKAGIMRRGKPVVYASREVPAAILRHAADTGADLVLAGRDYDWHVDTDGWRWRGRERQLESLVRPSLDGEVQVTNAAGVLALVEAAGFAELLTPQTVNAAFGSVTLPGRMQLLQRDRQWLLDVAHNPAAAEVLAAALANRPVEGRTAAIVGVLADKDVEGIVRALEPVVDLWIAVACDSHRAVPVAALARRIATAANRGCIEAASMADAIASARALTDAADRILVTGSFYVVGPALAAL